MHTLAHSDISLANANSYSDQSTLCHSAVLEVGCLRSEMKNTGAGEGHFLGLQMIVFLLIFPVAELEQEHVSVCLAHTFSSLTLGVRDSLQEF